MRELHLKVCEIHCVNSALSNLALEYASLGSDSSHHYPDIIVTEEMVLIQISKLLVVEPKKRLTAADALQHAFFRIDVSSCLLYLLQVSIPHSSHVSVHPLLSILPCSLTGTSLSLSLCTFLSICYSFCITIPIVASLCQCLFVPHCLLLYL